MCVRLFHWGPMEVYRFFNLGDERCMDVLPPPPNPEKLQQFFFAMVDVTISQMNKENGGGEASNQRPQRRRV